jgi:flavin-binding protein dodecin
MSHAGGKAMNESIYKIIEIVGTSEKSWDDAAKSAVEAAGKSLRDLRIAEVVAMDLKVEDNKVTAYRVRMKVSFKYEG